jgi:1-acyl-sn-glycerol-3-phosphate acyltransferase
MGRVRHAEVLVTLAREIRRGARIVTFGALTGGMLPGLVVHQRLARDRRSARRRWVGAWSAAMLRTFGVSALVRGALPAAGRGHLVVANHRSTADILVLLHTFGGLVVSRGDLARWPLVGLAARAAGTLFVDRSDAGSGATAVRTIRSRLSQGETVIVFPEGTTFPDDTVRPFHAGAFLAVARTDADVVPVGIAYEAGSGAAFVGETFTAHLARMAAAKPSRLALCIGGAIEGEGAKAASLRDRAQAAVQELVVEARRAVDARE